MSTYEIIDWRGKVLGCTPVSNIGTKRKSGGKIAAHYNGPDTHLGNMDPNKVTLADIQRQIEADARYQMVRGRYSPGFTVNGLMYHEVWFGRWVIILRDPDAVLWHASDQDYNYNATSGHIPIGEHQYPSARTIQTATERTMDLLRLQGTTSRAKFVGHKEVADDPTACPGHVMETIVYPFRAGKLNPGPRIEPKPWKLAKYNLLYSTQWGKVRSEDLATWINEAAGERLAASTRDPGEIVYASEEAYKSEPAGKLAAVCVGEKTAPLLHWSAQSALGRYDRNTSDIWDGRNTGELRDSLMEILGDEKLNDEDGVVARFTKKYGGSQANPTPRPRPEPVPPIDFGRYRKDSIEIIDQYGRSMRPSWQVPYIPVGRIIAEIADEMGWDLALFCAVTHKESMMRHVFGADWGRIGVDQVPFAHLPVTEPRWEALLNHVRQGKTSNGVGPNQITYSGYLYIAEKRGGGDNIRVAMEVGFEALADYIETYGYRRGLGAYNGGPSNPNMQYADSVIALHNEWKARLS